MTCPPRFVHDLGVGTLRGVNDRSEDGRFHDRRHENDASSREFAEQPPNLAEDTGVLPALGLLFFAICL